MVLEPEMCHITRERMVKWKKKQLVPAPYSRLSDQMFDMVSDKQRPQQKGRKLSCGPGAITSFNRGSKLEKVIPKSLTDVESEH